MIDKLKRDDNMKTIGNLKDDKSVCLVDIQVVIPVRYVKIGLCTVGVDVTTIAIFAMVSGGRYRSYTIPANIKFTPSKTDILTHDGVEYYAFHVSKGQPFAHRKVVQDPDIIKRYVDETIIKGNISFFTSYSDIRLIYDNFHKYVGSRIADDVVIMSVFNSLLARVDSDLTKQWRQHKPGDKLKFVGLSSVGLSRTDGFSQMTGAYMKEGIVAASLAEKDVPTEIETIIK